MSDTAHREIDGRGWPEPWPAVFELARQVGPAHGALIGGLMVQLHHRLHGVEPPRATRDIDALARVEVTWREHYVALVNGLRSLGYEATRSLDAAVPLHRMTRADRGGEVHVDFLIADHVPPPVEAELPRPLPVQAPGGRNALDRLLYVTVHTDHDSVVVAVPDLIGALELKVEAFHADSRDRERHLQDAVALAGLIGEDAPEPPLHGTAETRLRRFVGWMDDDERLANAGISRDDAADAAIAVERVLEHLVGPEPRC